MNIEFRNLEQVYLNGVATTFAEIWEERYIHETDDNYFVFAGKASVNGHWKKTSTFAKKLKEQGDFY